MRLTHHGGVHEGILPDERAAQVGVVGGRTHRAKLAARRIDLARGCSEQADVGMGVQISNLPSQALRQRHVVGVEPREQAARAGEGEGPVQGGGEATAGPPFYAQPRIAEQNPGWPASRRQSRRR